MVTARLGSREPQFCRGAERPQDQRQPLPTALPTGPSPPFLPPPAPRKRAAYSTSVTSVGITVIAKHRHHEPHPHFVCPLPWQLGALCKHTLPVSLAFLSLLLQGGVGHLTWGE